MHHSLRECEREVEQARSKLSHDLATLRAPETFSSFTDDLKRDALETKDAIIDQAKDAAQSKLAGFVDDLKARAAANPAAALAIGAGIAWRLLRHPPIATALIGAGIYSLWRTNGYQPHGRSNAEYLQRGKERLVEQAGDFAASASAAAKEAAAEVGDAVAAKTAEVVETAKAKAQEWSGAAEAKAEEWSQAAQTRTQEWSDEVGRRAAAVTSALKAETESLNAKAASAVRSISDGALGASDRSAKFMREVLHEGRDVLTESEPRDKLLLGIAGVAVAAALGIACQKRIAEEA
jgi:hypothetical protein